MRIDGSCHCGRITYRAEIDPEKVYLCHCSDCQAISGSPYRWAVSTPAENFELLTGEPKTYVKQTADSGVTNHQVFCPDCASPLYSTSLRDGPRMLNIRLGTVRQRHDLGPRVQSFCRSAQGWATDLGGVARND